MSFLKKISRIFASPTRREESGYWIYARCNRCGEALRSRVDLYNELSLDYEDETPVYLCRKVLIGETRCFQPIEVWLKFDQSRKLISSEISGGELISAVEYNQAHGRT